LWHFNFATYSFLILKWLDDVWSSCITASVCQKMSLGTSMENANIFNPLPAMSKCEDSQLPLQTVWIQMKPHKTKFKHIRTISKTVQYILKPCSMEYKMVRNHENSVYTILMFYILGNLFFQISVDLGANSLMWSLTLAPAFFNWTRCLQISIGCNGLIYFHYSFLFVCKKYTPNIVFSLEQQFVRVKLSNIVQIIQCFFLFLFYWIVHKKISNHSVLPTM